MSGNAGRRSGYGRSPSSSSPPGKRASSLGSPRTVRARGAPSPSQSGAARSPSATSTAPSPTPPPLVPALSARPPLQPAAVASASAILTASQGGPGTPTGLGISGIQPAGGTAAAIGPLTTAGRARRPRILVPLIAAGLILGSLGIAFISVHGPAFGKVLLALAGSLLLTNALPIGSGVLLGRPFLVVCREVLSSEPTTDLSEIILVWTVHKVATAVMWYLWLSQKISLPIYLGALFVFAGLVCFVMGLKDSTRSEAVLTDVFLSVLTAFTVSAVLPVNS